MATASSSSSVVEEDYQGAISGGNSSGPSKGGGGGGMIRHGSPISDRSQVSLEEDDLASPNPTRDALAEGIVSLLSPTLNTLDQGVLATKRSQEELSEQIALLTDQLKVISAEQVCPIDLDGYVTRLGVIKGKINVISSVLHAAQERLNKVHEQAVKEASRRKPLLEPAPIFSSAASVSSGSYNQSSGAAGGFDSDDLGVDAEEGEEQTEGIQDSNRNSS